VLQSDAFTIIYALVFLIDDEEEEEEEARPCSGINAGFDRLMLGKIKFLIQSISRLTR